MSKRQTVFFLPVDPLDKKHKDPDKIDLEAPRLAWYKQKTWKKHQSTVYWVDIKLAQKKGFKFYQTRSNGTIFYDTLRACCIPKAIMMGTGEIIYEEINKRVFPDCESTNVRTGRLVSSCVPVSVERLDQDKDADHVRTVRPIESEQSIGLFTQREEIDINFRVSGLPHAVVKQAENFRVRELVMKIESHPHRPALQADLQPNNAYNPFSDDSKAMIREMSNVELFEFCETIPKVQCSECFLYWNQGVIYCTCGHLLVESESNQNFSQWRLDALSIPHYVIKKGRPHGAGHGKTDA